MAQSYGEPTRRNPCKSGARSFSVGGNRVYSTLSILCTLCEAIKGEVAFCGIGFSDFVRTCMIKDLAKKGA